MSNKLPMVLADIIEADFQFLMPAFSSETAHDLFSLDENYIRFFVLEEDREYFSLTASLISSSLSSVYFLRTRKVCRAIELLEVSSTPHLGRRRTVVDG
ncbi:hypothetical protein [Tumebacillus permanentifrigoris]|uniref:hypothetical protein n=1 Tax=Tumebacillus permanentifrigoris TaxID=378543 RepID=UPI000D6BE054|nr:hypothetical protein [Tumebacillus permanentifrigoris]